MTKHPITAVVIAKNEATGISRCVRSLAFCDQIIVVDSGSTDGTAEIAKSAGADVLEFDWNRKYPKKKQWGMDHESVKHNWVLHMDADEIVSPALADEITRAISTASSKGIAAFEIPISYYFMGKQLRYGHRVIKRSLVDRRFTRFPEVGDLDAPGITEVEGHYQPEIAGAIAKLAGQLIHDDPDPLNDWISRHNRYSDWEAYLVLNPDVRNAVRERRSAGGQLFDKLPFKPFIFFLYAYVIKLGFLDGRAGLDYAGSLSWYYWTIGAKIRDARRLKLSPRKP